MKPPDVIVTVSDQLAIFEPQTRQAMSWFQQKFEADIENAHDQIYMETGKCREIIAALREAGFVVLT